MEDEAFIWYLTNWDFEKETYPVYYKYKGNKVQTTTDAERPQNL